MSPRTGMTSSVSGFHSSLLLHPGNAIFESGNAEKQMI